MKSRQQNGSAAALFSITMAIGIGFAPLAGNVPLAPQPAGAAHRHVGALRTLMSPVRVADNAACEQDYTNCLNACSDQYPDISSRANYQAYHECTDQCQADETSCMSNNS